MPWQPVESEVPFQQNVVRLRRRAALFDEMRKVLRLAADLPEDETPHELDEMHKKFDNWVASLYKRRPARGHAGDIRRAIDVILEHIENHGHNLWGHAILRQEGGCINIRLISRTNMQRRIQGRRQWEKSMREKEAASPAAKPRRKPSRKSAKSFSSLQSEIFQNKISDIQWRSRQQLGGSVAAQLSFAHFNFNSWAAASRNEIHWADASHWKSKKIPHAAKFFARADETSFAWGFYIERPDATGSASADWDAFIRWLRREENDQWLREVAHHEGLEVYDAHKSCFVGVIRPREADWAVEGSSVRTSADELGVCIDSWPATAWLDLMIAKRISMAEAIGRTEAIADDIAALFGRLLPLYEAAVSHLS